MLEAHLPVAPIGLNDIVGRVLDQRSQLARCGFSRPPLGNVNADDKEALHLTRGQPIGSQSVLQVPHLSGHELIELELLALASQGGGSSDAQYGIVLLSLSSACSITYVPLHLASGGQDGFVTVALDVTQQKLQESRLKRLAQRDPLTGLLNRAGFEDALSALDPSTTPLAVLYIDLDRFKPRQ